MPDHKVQHFLARSYLRGFTAGLIKGQPQIWILDKQTKEIRLGSPNKSAAFSYYYSSQLPDGSYDNSIEESFSKLENDFLGVVERARANVEASNLGGFAPAPTLKDRIVLCRYIYLHFLRVPQNMEWIRSGSSRHLERMDQMGLLEFGESNLQNYVMKAFTHIDSKVSGKAVEILSSKNVAIEYAVRRRASVFTCDNPVFRYNPRGAEGIVYEDTNIFFPLYYRAYVRLQGSGNQLGIMKHHDISLIDDLNRALIRNATREIFANDSERLKAAAEAEGIEAVINTPKGMVFDSH